MTEQFPRQVQPVTGLILSGGKGRRMNNADKGLVNYQGRPLVQHVIDRIRPQVDTLYINCYRNLSRYEQFSLPLLTDALADFAGPLRGILSVEAELHSDYCFVAPCDMPRLPGNIVERLRQSIGNKPAAHVVAAGQIQPLVLLLRSDCFASIARYLNDGQRSVKGWLALTGSQPVLVDDEPNAFDNVNSLTDKNPESGKAE